MIDLSWGDIEEAAKQLAGRWRGITVMHPPTGVYGIPQGGCVPAVMVARELDLPIVDEPGENTLVVDDLVDTGCTAGRVVGRKLVSQAHVTRPEYDNTFAYFDALYRKPHSPVDMAPDAIVLDGWANFPWERHGGVPTDAVTRLIQFIGEDPTREGLVDTPKRVTKALREMTDGYRQDPVAILRSAEFASPSADQLIVIGPFPFYSMCEHHMLPFSGMAAVSYIPKAGRVTGLSKIPRAVEALSRRLQMQETLTAQIADALEEAIEPYATGVVLRAHHSCSELRGVKCRTVMTTSATRGLFRDSPAARAELMALIDHGGK